MSKKKAVGRAGVDDEVDKEERRLCLFGSNICVQNCYHFWKENRLVASVIQCRGVSCRLHGLTLR